MAKLINFAKKAGNSRVSWALIDQAILSLGNFSIVIVLARGLTPVDLGTYALLFGLFQMINSIQGGLFIYPMTIFISRKEEAPARLIGSTTMLFLPTMLPGACVLWIGVWVVGAQEIYWHVLAAMVFWQMSNLYRRGLTAQLQHRRAVVGDAVSYLGQSAFAFALLWLGWLTLGNAFLVMAVTSAAAIAVQWLQLRPSFADRGQIKDYFRRSFELGRWVSMSSLLTSFTGQVIGWVVVYGHSKEAIASLRAVGNLCGATHPLTSGLRGLLMPSVAHAHKDGLQPALVSSMGLIIVACVLVLPILMVFLALPGFVLGIFYGFDSFYATLTILLQLYAVNYVIRLFLLLLEATNQGLAKAKESFQIRRFGLYTSLCIGVPLAYFGGPIYAVIGYCINNAVLLFLFYRVIRRYMREQDVHFRDVLHDGTRRITKFART